MPSNVVLKGNDGSSKFGNPDLYLPSEYKGRYEYSGNLTPHITRAFQTALAAAMSVAAARSGAATGRR